ncbi:hypothetical protein GCM10011342_25010 [Aquisalinus flavus]|uniref:Uncharacterized protein n=1 Tax=Aquisalinus flavus TaxID=1526572 RepID=A0A8J2Y463_9PROT|nr:hypothetical protein GCM10011342_25010 [Aquisalinus flavus]
MRAISMRPDSADLAAGSGKDGTVAAMAPDDSLCQLRRHEAVGDRARIEIPYPKRSPEDIYSPYSMVRGITSRHTRDLILYLVSIIAGVYSLLFFVGSFGNLLNEEILFGPTALVPFGAAFLAGIGTVYQIGKRRFATVDLFSSEITARVRISASDGFIEKLISQFDHAGFREAEDRHHRQAISIEPSGELTFELFHRHYEQLGSLTPPIVDYVCDYYNYVMSVRDEIRDLQHMLTDPGVTVSERRHQVMNVLFFIDIAMFSAYRALDALIEKDINKWHAWQLSCYVGVVANNFVREVMPADDPRYSEVQHRAARYRDTVKQLNRNLKRHHARLGLKRGEMFF